MELAGERDALVEAVRALPLAGGAVDSGDEGGGAAERAQGQALALLELERLAVLVGEDDPQVATAHRYRHAGDGFGGDYRVEALRDVLVDVARKHDDVVVLERALGDGRFVQGALEALEEGGLDADEPATRTDGRRRRKGGALPA